MRWSAITAGKHTGLGDRVTVRFGRGGAGGRGIAVRASVRGRAGPLAMAPAAGAPAPGTAGAAPVSAKVGTMKRKAPDKSDAIERMNRFVQRMNEVDRNLTAPYVAPKDAATLILVDRSAPTPKVLLGKRQRTHKFMPGKFVFPGGRVDPGDRRMPVARALNPAAEANLLETHHASKPRPRHRRLRSRRFARPLKRLACCSAPGHRGCQRVPKGPWTGFAQAKILPDLADLHFIGRAITPPGRARRFDARFFTLDASAIAHSIEGVTGPDAELIELVWMPFTEAKQLDMPAVTGVMLEELDARIADGFGSRSAGPFLSNAARTFYSASCSKLDGRRVS